MPVVIIQSKASGRFVAAGDPPVFDGWTEDHAQAHDFGSVRAADEFIFQELGEGDQRNYGSNRKNLHIVQDGTIVQPDMTRLNPDGPTGQGW